jgi:arylsulfatase A
VEKACEWLEYKSDSDSPFFMYVASHEPHTPINPPAEYKQMYANEVTDQLEKGIEYGRVNRPVKDISANKKEYYGTVTQLDNAFGRLTATLDRLGLRENTVVIFTSDNGPETPVTLEETRGDWDDPIRDKCFGTPGELRGMKRFPYEGGHRVPGIVRFPGVIPEASVSDILFNGTDFLPTLCGLVDATIPDDRAIDGVDAFNAFLKEDVSRDVSSIWFYPNHEDTYFRMPQMAMRKDGYTLIGWLPEKPDSMNLRGWMSANDPVKFELYEMASDPMQVNDISKQETERVRSMEKEMLGLWREIRDEGLSGDI